MLNLTIAMKQIYSKWLLMLKKIFNMNSETTFPYLIAGLGNPGKTYRGNRHNVGFMALDRLAQKLDVNFSRLESKALVAKANFLNQRLVLAKPQTYMNLSGQSIAALVRFYRIPLSQMMVIYDDVDLPLGVLRLRPAGGSSGQKGMVSIIERLGSQDFPRLRIGIGRPPGRMEAADYVLQDFSKSDLEFLDPTLDRAVSALLEWFSKDLDSAMNKYNGNEQNGA